MPDNSVVIGRIRSILVSLGGDGRGKQKNSATPAFVTVPKRATVHETTKKNSVKLGTEWSESIGVEKIRCRRSKKKLGNHLARWNGCFSSFLSRSESGPCCCRATWKEREREREREKKGRAGACSAATKPTFKF